MKIMRVIFFIKDKPNLNQKARPKIKVSSVVFSYEMNLLYTK